MGKKYAWLIITSAVILFFIITCFVLAFFGVEVFILAHKFTEFIGILSAVMFICLCIVIFMYLNSRKEQLPKGLVIGLKIGCVFFTVLFSFIGLAVSSFLGEKTVNRIISEDKRHEIVMQEDETFGGYNITLYKRTGPMFKQEKRNFYIDDLAGEPDSISVIWYDDGCDVSYMRYPDMADSPEPEEFVQRLYYSGEYVEI